MSNIESFKKIFKGEIVEPSSPEYPKAIARWAKNAERNARYVLFPKDEQDVSEAVKFATANGLPLAVKGGGHNPSGASSIDDGVSIDLNRHFDTARIDPENKLGYVGGGALWRTVDHAAIKHGLATPGGTVNHTGVGGLILGGGFGYLSGKHGLTIDNLVQATVVLADGSIVTASDTSHPDLFWAIRGGGGNFGIVTEFVLKLHPQRRTVFAGIVLFAPPVLQQLVAVLDNWWKEAPENGLIMFGFACGPDRGPIIMTVLFYNGSEEEGRQHYKPLLDLGPVVDMAKEIPYEQVNGMWNQAANAHGRRYYMTGTSLKSTLAAHAAEVFEHTIKFSEKHPTDPSRPPLEVLVNYELLPHHKICQVPSDATAYRSRGPQPNVLVMISWDQEEKDQADVKHARTFSREIAAIVNASAERELKENENQGYGNYSKSFSVTVCVFFAYRLSQKVTDPTDLTIRSLDLWGDNYPRLQKIKYKYDPTCVFNKWIPIQPSAT
ncbi:hypothetical protein Clacol_004090 [Clathrus columnatus]|uniref:FAD-binding PCMH-type domain-containing protein n=1 Tax=Clathrus columnatus TaxID=1419009 RepID=A0AAV5AA37_9AGAM|nr:hypothetical protein Clacol_004090 [Clathrus columnatus]